jgi:hypothetical protein
MISDHKHNYSYSITMHPNRKRRLSGAKKSPDRGESSSGPQIIPAEQIYEIPRSQDIKKANAFPSVHKIQTAKQGVL